MKVFFDGGCRPAPFGMEWAVVIAGRSHVSRDLGPGSAMAAEWLALIAARQLAYEHGLADAMLLGDAAAVIAQATGAVRCPRACLPLMDTFRTLPAPAGRLRIRYVKRSQNLAGIALEARRRR